MLSLVRSIVPPCVCLSLFAPACSDDGGGVPGGLSEGSSGAATGAGETSGGGETTGETGAPTSGAPTTAAGSTGDLPPSPWDGEPLPDAPPGQWTWVPFADARCRDGSTTGIGVRYGAGDGLVIYFQGGGACFNGLTCGANPASFDEGDFAGLASGGNGGIFDPDPGANPVGDWSFIFVPYCTGDVHAGDRTDQVVPLSLIHI